MNLVIPKSQRGVVRYLLSLPKETLANLNRAIEKSQPQLSSADFVARLSSDGARLEIPALKLTHLIELFVVWCAIRLDLESSSREMVDALKSAALKSSDANIHSGWEAIESEIEKTLSLKPLCMMAKARDVGTMFFRSMFEARIISDARPLFSADPDKSPDGFVITHTLRINAREESGQKDWYFALDLDDLENLRKAVDRALKKHRTLKAFLDATSARVIE